MKSLQMLCQPILGLTGLQWLSVVQQEPSRKVVLHLARQLTLNVPPFALEAEQLKELQQFLYAVHVSLLYHLQLYIQIHAHLKLINHT